MDYVGPMQAIAYDGYTSMVNILVEPFHLAATYPLEKSSGAQLVALRAFITNLKVCILDSRVIFLKADNTREYTNGTIAGFCAAEVIMQEFSAPCCLQ